MALKISKITAAKILISFGLLTWLLMTQIDYSKLGNIFIKVDIGLLFVVLLIRIIGYFVSALRWQKMLQCQGVVVKLMPLYYSYIVSTFFNLFLPTNVGGDVIRASDLRLANNSFYASAATVVVERFLGISTLFLFALIASLARLSQAQQIHTIWIGISLGFFVLMSFVFIIYTRYATFFIKLIPNRKLSEKINYGWQEFRNSAMPLLKNTRANIWGISYSILLQLLVIVQFYIIGKALDFKVPMLDYFFLMPIQLVLLMLPTINGIGLRDGSNIILFGLYGISSTDAVAFGFIDFGMMILFGIMGWIRFITRRKEA